MGHNLRARHCPNPSQAWRNPLPSTLHVCSQGSRLPASWLSPSFLPTQGHGGKSERGREEEAGRERFLLWGESSQQWRVRAGPGHWPLPIPRLSPEASAVQEQLLRPARHAQNTSDAITSTINPQRKPLLWTQVTPQTQTHMAHVPSSLVAAVLNVEPY